MSSGRRNISAGLKNLGVRKVTPRFFDGWNNLKTVSADSQITGLADGQDLFIA